MSAKRSYRQCYGQVGATRGQGGPHLNKRTMLVGGHAVGNREMLHAVARYMRGLSDLNLAQKIYSTRETLRAVSKKRGLSAFRCTVRRISRQLKIAKRELNRRKA